MKMEWHSNPRYAKKSKSNPVAGAARSNTPESSTPPNTPVFQTPPLNPLSRPTGYVDMHAGQKSKVKTPQTKSLHPGYVDMTRGRARALSDSKMLDSLFESDINISGTWLPGYVDKDMTQGREKTISKSDSKLGSDCESGTRSPGYVDMTQGRARVIGVVYPRLCRWRQSQRKKGG